MKHNVLDPRKHPWRFIGVVLGSMVLVFVILMAWIGLTVLMNQDTAHPVAADVVFNYLLVSLLSFIGLPFFHWAMLRRHWQQEQRRLAGLPNDPNETIAAAMLAAEPLPKTRKSWQQKVLYVGLYIYGIALLMSVFGPLDNQRWLIRMIARFSAGSASFGSLANLVIFVPAGLMLLLLFFVLDRETDGLERGQLDPAETLRLRMKQQWLFSFVAALTAAAFLCFFVGRMTAAYLS
ncbi:hypothetical protein FXN63_04405 [Pigmentiphaga aceris]|uniref:Uncharacterized protein n=1 Tax=Pigmentiphaga aceris TaxID=1940612 RepID=A0A5C0AWT1_9BURK|nr:hypothetical protein [Pigmentiphaga aceris]QEI05161.1 hypothetical protein FXN63_04405 [Pigmentiphaga aceris]